MTPCMEAESLRDGIPGSAERRHCTRETRCVVPGYLSQQRTGFALQAVPQEDAEIDGKAETVGEMMSIVVHQAQQPRLCCGDELQH